MNDSMRENLSYFRLYKKMFSVKKNVKPEKFFLESIKISISYIMNQRIF